MRISYRGGCIGAVVWGVQCYPSCAKAAQTRAHLRERTRTSTHIIGSKRWKGRKRIQRRITVRGKKELIACQCMSHPFGKPPAESVSFFTSQWLESIQKNILNTECGIVLKRLIERVVNVFWCGEKIMRILFSINIKKLKSLSISFSICSFWY